MKAPTRLPITLFCSVGSLALLYAGVAVYAHTTHAPTVPIPINTIIIVLLVGAEVVFALWWIAAHFTNQLIVAQQANQATRTIRAVVPAHHISVYRSRADRSDEDETKKVVRRPPRRRRTATKSAPTPPSQVPGLDAEVIELGRKISGKIERSGA